ncbi:MAG: 8-oxo-dGTP diphosphatase [Candidatus Kerfeldbacteria bacterium]|nr:8-oxo-dGTP diphosphatase [Candidatus Kerfeldbacteria bacterium]
MTQGTVVFVFRGDEVLLAMKKRGFGNGRWNGLGGKVHNGETPGQAVAREAKEEAGIDVVVGKPLGTATFYNSSKGDWVVDIFATEQFSGEPVETEEMKPQWFNVKEIPYDQMWDDDKFWYPWLFKRQPFRAEFWFGPDEKVVRHEIAKL